MKVFQFLDPIFRGVNDGNVIRVTVVWAIRVMAVVLAAVGFVWCIGFIALGFKGSEMMIGARSAELLIAALLFAVFGLAFGYLACGVCLFRARCVADLGNGHFTVLPILSILFRLLGEVACICYCLIGVGGCLVLWIAGFNPLANLGRFAPELPLVALGSGGFVGGLEFAIFMLVLAFGAIVSFYALAEFTVVAVDIANNTRALTVPVFSRSEMSSPSPLQAGPVSAVPSSNGHSSRGPFLCKSCRQPVEPGAAFCADCGLPVAK